MKKNLIYAIVAPCILTVVLIIIIVMDSSNSKRLEPPENGTEAAGMVTPTAEPTAAPTPMPQVVPTQEAAPTQAPTKAPTPTPSPAPTAAPTVTVAPTPTPVPQETDDITVTPTNPEGSDTPDAPVQGGIPGEKKPDSTGTYDALYTQQGEEYTLIADGITGCWLLLKNSDHSLRQTEFHFAEEYREVGSIGNGPVFGYKNKVFFFMADNQLVASDGERETVLYTAGEAYKRGLELVNKFAESENRVMLSMARGTLVVADSRTLQVETYTHRYTPMFFALSDDALCFSWWTRVPAGRYYNTLYTAKGGIVRLLGVIGDIDTHVLDGNTLIITNDEDSYQIDMHENRITASHEPEREYTLYYPVFVTCYINDLSEIRYIQYNLQEQPIQSIDIPDSWDLDCYYAVGAKPKFFYEFRDREKAGKIPANSGGFTVVNTSSFPLTDSKYLYRSAMKEKLFEGETVLGAGEIYLLAKTEQYFAEIGAYQVSQGEAEFEIIYAWIPIQGTTEAYQFYFYVPLGEAYQDYLTLMKHMIKAK